MKLFFKKIVFLSLFPRARLFPYLGVMITSRVIGSGEREEERGNGGTRARQTDREIEGALFPRFFFFRPI